MTESFDQWQFVWAAYAIGGGATLAMVVFSWLGMQRAERRRDSSRDGAQD
ncbi:hypothetical protein [Novosphingobium ovatum]|nr:hypothetical protein [Novosphingobium ovatum]